MEKRKTKAKERLTKKQRGITLIALVITIIVLLILAGVSIAMLTGQNGILTQAQNAKEETEQAAQDEADILDDYNKKLDEWTNGEAVSIPEGLKVGSEVHYDPDGTYSTDEERRKPLSETYSGSANNPESISSASGEPYNIDTWKVLDINATTGEVTLVPESSTDSAGGYIYLNGAQGYNNGVKILNDVCNALYGNSSKGITARSINITDIEEKMSPEKVEETHSNYNVGPKVEEGYSQENSWYPSIYAQEKLNGVNGTQSSSGLEMSDQTSFIEPGENNGKIQGNTLRPTHTYWYEDNSFMQSAFEEKDGVNYYDLLFPDDISTTYWLASRCVGITSSYCNFEVSNVYEGELGASIMFRSYDDDFGDICCGLFPVVSLSSELISVNESGVFEVK